VDNSQDRLLAEIRDALAESLRCQQQSADVQRQLLDYQRDLARQQHSQRRWFVMFAVGSSVLVMGVCAMLFATLLRSTPTMPLVVPSPTAPVIAYPPPYFNAPQSDDDPFGDPPAESTLKPVEPSQVD